MNDVFELPNDYWLPDPVTRFMVDQKIVVYQQGLFHSTQERDYFLNHACFNVQGHRTQRSPHPELPDREQWSGTIKLGDGTEYAAIVISGPVQVTATTPPREQDQPTYRHPALQHLDILIAAKTWDELPEDPWRFAQPA